MAYVKQEWKDEVLNGAEKYKITRSDGTIIAENVSVELITQILQAGTPITAERMNHIEDGIANCAEKIHAGSHARGGSDVITPESIGAMNASPTDINMGGTPVTGGSIRFRMNGEAPYTSQLAEFSRNQLRARGIDPSTFVFSVDGYISSKNINDSGWIEVGLINGWTRTPDGVARFRKYNNIIFIVCQVDGAAATSSKFTQLPYEFSPPTRVDSVCIKAGGVTVGCAITAGGGIWLSTPNYKTKFSFSGSWIGKS